MNFFSGDVFQLQGFCSTVLDPRLVGEQGGVELVVTSMREHPHNMDLQQSACSAFWNLTLDAENRKFGVECGGLAVLQQATLTHPQNFEVQLYSLRAIKSLVRENLQTVKDLGVLQWVQQAMDQFADAQIQSLGSELLLVFDEVRVD